MKKVIGIGGIFFKSSNPQLLRDWYSTHLGLNMEPWGCKLDWKAPDDESGEAYTTWSPFKEDTTYFAPSQKAFMLNFVVENLDNLLAQLRVEGVHVIDKKEEGEFGKFGWILDPEENKIELWEPPKKSM